MITDITMKRYQMLKKLFDEIMDCSDKEEVKTWILRKKNNGSATSYVFNKIVRALLNEPNFDLMG